jgi:enamine deaminase RidA (YjgF/YER057c/UK114 family)
MADIVKLNIFLVAEVDQAAVPKLRAIRDRYINVENPPASTLVVVPPGAAGLADRDRGSRGTGRLRA